MRTEERDFKRKQWFDKYQEMTNPYIYLTVRVDITNIINYCKINKNYYATIGYFILLSANELDCFKYRLENNKIYKYENLRSSSVELLDDEIIYINCNLNEYNKYLKEYNSEKQRCINNKEIVEGTDQGVIWFSCTPWFNFQSVITPYDKKITIPQFIWDKYVLEDGKYFINLTIMIHHGFADGKDIAEFLSILNKKIDSFDEVIGR